MQSAEIYRLLSRRPRRGRVIFGTLSVALPLFGGLALATGRVSWAVAAFFAGLLFGLGFRLVRENYVLARDVSEDPQLVYWAHTTPIPPQNRWLFVFTKLHFLTLHLRGGRHFEAGLPPEEMRSFITWLTQQNPSARMGAYDNTESNSTKEPA